ncbi:MAG: heme-binding Shp domain-containing protein [Lachnospiraceae bacterium]
MIARTKTQKLLAGVIAAVLALVLGAGALAVKVQAASGTVYTCTINRCYSHPVTGVIEDSGGEAAYATGQGMVEGCIYSSGMLEVTDAGEYYLTARMSLTDYTSNINFQVQSIGASGWSSTTFGVTATGSDSNGTTADYCIKVPSENCVVRLTMYVTPMGRDVVGYFYPSNYSEGNSSGMTATIVTEASSGSGSSTTTTDGSTSTSGDSTATTSPAASTTAEASDESTDSTSTDELQSSVLESSDESGSVSTDSELSDAQGLSLSTATGSSEEESESTNSGNQVFVLASAVTISGLILIAVAAAVVYYYRKNWSRWGGEDDE